MMAEERLRYALIQRGSPHEQAFRDGVDRNGNAQERCPLCDGRRLTKDPAGAYCDEHHQWFTQAMYVACHTCRVRWGVVVERCPECVTERPAS